MGSDVQNDWAVIELASNVNAEPYLVNPNAEVPAGGKISLAAASHHNFHPGVFPPAIEKDCDVPDSDPSHRTFKTNCSSGQGSSGGAFFAEEENRLYLKAVVSRTMLDPDYDYHLYSKFVNFTEGVQVKGEFYETLLEATQARSR